MACKVCTFVRSIVERFAAQRAKRAERRKERERKARSR